MLVIADAIGAQAIAGVMGGAGSEVSPAHAHGRVRERVLQAGVGPAHEQAARSQDRGVVALRARRRHQRAGRRAAARGRADASRSAPAASVGPVIDRYPTPRGPRALHLRRARLARAARASRCPTPTSHGSCAASGSTVTRGRRRLGRRGADVPRRSAARGRSDRGGRPPLRLRQARADVSRR